MGNVILALILAAIVCGAVFYLLRAKKRGQKCIGCPYSRKCSFENGCCSSYSPKEKFRKDNETK